MKRLCLIILMLVVVIVPISLTGCGRNYKPQEVITMYQTVVAENGKDYFKDGKFKVTYNQPVVAASIYDQNSPLYILGEVYEPIINSVSEMVASHFASTTIQTTLEKFSQEALNALNNAFKDLNETLASFNSAKVSFENANRITAGGIDLASFLGEYNMVIEDLINLNTIFCEEYYSKVTLTTRALTDTIALASGDVTNEIMQSKLYFADFIYNVYVKNYTISNPPTSVKNFLAEGSSAHLKTTLTILKKSHASGSVNGTVKVATIKRYLTTMRNSYDIFHSDFDLNKEAIKGFDYKGYFAEPAKDPFIKAQTSNAQDDFYLNQNFLATRFSARLSLLDSLITTFTTI